MKPEKKGGLRPKLRFPEFEAAGEWEERRLGMVSDVRDGTHDSPNFYSMGMPFLTSKNLLLNGLLDTKNVNYISTEDYEKFNKRSKVNIGDILFGMIGTIGNPVMVQTDGFAIKNVALIKQQGDLLNCYLVYLLNSQYIAKKIYILNTGNSQKFIALGQLRNLPVLIPSLQEQQKIADCLASVDELITAEAQKIEALKAHKKGLLQQLFPANDETTPSLRFPEFRESAGWAFIKLGDVGELKNGINFSAEQKGSGTLTVDVLNMYGPGIEMRLDSLYRVDIEAKDYLLQDNDILFVRSSLKRDGVGWASLFRKSTEPVFFCGFLIRFC